MTEELIEQTKRKIAEAIAVRIAELELNHSQAGKLMGLDRTTTCSIVNGHVRGHTLHKIMRGAEALGIRVSLDASVEYEPLMAEAA